MFFHRCDIAQTPHKEEDSGEPWTFVAKHKLQVEQELRNMADLRYTVLRPAIVYGCGDRNGLGNTRRTDYATS
jgi:dTDP-4-dehydrorhamnose reductase